MNIYKHKEIKREEEDRKESDVMRRRIIKKGERFSFLWMGSAKGGLGYGWNM